MREYRYWSAWQAPSEQWYAHIHTDDLEEAKGEAELDHMDHPERAYGVMDNQTGQLVYKLDANVEVA